MIENNINEISPSNSSRSSSKKGNFAQIRSNLKCVSKLSFIVYLKRIL